MDPTTFTYNVPHLIIWDWRIAADLFFGGIGVGAFLLAVINSLYYKDKYASVSKVGAILAPIMVALGLLLMLSELGHPLKMWLTLTNFNPSSPLSWGGIFQGLLLALSALYAYQWIKGSPSKSRNLVGMIGIPVALIVGAYHGWLLTILRARPLWNTGPSMVTALLGFATTGMAAVLLAICLSPKLRQNTEGSAPWMIRDFRHLLVVAMVVQGLTFFVWWISLLYGPASAREALRAANESRGMLFWIVGIGLGLIVPIGLQITEAIKHSEKPDRLNVPLTIATTALILVGGFVFRYAVVIGGQVS